MRGCGRIGRRSYSHHPSGHESAFARGFSTRRWVLLCLASSHQEEKIGIPHLKFLEQAKAVASRTKSSPPRPPPGSDGPALAPLDPSHRIVKGRSDSAETIRESVHGGRSAPRWTRRENRSAHDSCYTGGETSYLDPAGRAEHCEPPCRHSTFLSRATGVSQRAGRQTPEDRRGRAEGSGPGWWRWYPHRTCWPSAEQRRRRRIRSLHGSRGGRVRAEGGRHRVLRLGLGVPHRPPSLLGHHRLLHLLLDSSSTSN
jgi:hypothetical protein